MEGWSHQDVMTWLNKLKFKENVLKVFQDYEVEGQDLLVLSDEELDAMGIASKLARLRLTVKRESHKHLSEPIVLQDETPMAAEAMPAPPPRSSKESGLPSPEREHTTLERQPSTRKDAHGYELPEREAAADYEKIPAEQEQAEGFDPLAMSDTNGPPDDRDYEIIEGEGNASGSDNDEAQTKAATKDYGGEDAVESGYSRAVNDGEDVESAYGVANLSTDPGYRTVEPVVTEGQRQHDREAGNHDEDDDDDDEGEEEGEGEGDTEHAGTRRRLLTGIFTNTYDKLRNTLRRKGKKTPATEKPETAGSANDTTAGGTDKGTGTLQRMGYGIVNKTACDTESVNSTDSAAQVHETGAATGVKEGASETPTSTTDGNGTPGYSTAEHSAGPTETRARSDSEGSDEVAVFGFGFNRLSIRRGKTGPQSEDNEGSGKSRSSSFATTRDIDVDMMDEEDEEQEDGAGDDNNGEDYEMLWESTTGDGSNNGGFTESKFMQSVRQGVPKAPSPASVANKTSTLRARVSSPQEMRPRAATTGAGGRRVIRRAITAPTGELIDFSAVHRPAAMPRDLTGRMALSKSTDNTTATNPRRMSLAAGVVKRPQTQYHDMPHMPRGMRTQRAQSVAMTMAAHQNDVLPPFQQELRDSLIHQVKRARSKGGNEMASIIYTRTHLDVELCQQLAKELRLCQLVSTVILDRCHLTADMVHHIAVALPHHSSIRKLSLEHNKIKDKGAEVLSQALRRNASLKQLNVSHNKIGLEGARALIRATRYVFGYGEYNLSLEQVDISGNAFSKRKVKALLKDDTDQDTQFVY